MALADKDTKGVITTKYGESVPPTYDKGKYPIDGIFFLKALQNMKGQYISVNDQVFYDRCGLWLGISYSNMFGHNLPEIIRSRMQQVRCSDPRITNAINQCFQCFSLENRLHK